MVTRKITISLDGELAERLQREVRREHASVSGWIAGAIESRLRNLALGELIAEYETEAGAFSEAEKKATETFWQESLSTPEPSSHSSAETVVSGGSSPTSMKKRAG